MSFRHLGLRNPIVAFRGHAVYQVPVEVGGFAKIG